MKRLTSLLLFVTLPAMAMIGFAPPLVHKATAQVDNPLWKAGRSEVIKR